MKFSAYPEQGIPRWHKKWLTVALVGTCFFIAMFSSVSSRPLNSSEIKNIDYVQPLLTSSGFEMGIWTGHPQNHPRDEDGAPIARGAAADSAEKQDAALREAHQAQQAVQELTQELQAEREKSRNQELEIAELRRSLELERASSGQSRRRGERDASSVEESESSWEAKSRAGAELGQYPTTTTQALRTATTTSSWIIPDSLWRQPPGGAPAPTASPVAAQVPTSAAAANYSGSAAPKEQEDGGSRVIVKAGGTDIVVHIGTTPGSKDSKDQAQEPRSGPPSERAAAAAQPAPLPRPPPVESGDPLLDAPADAPAAARPPPDEPQATPEPTSAPAAPARSEDDDGSITVRAGGTEISVKIAKASGDGSEGADKPARPQAPAKDPPHDTATTTPLAAPTTTTLEAPWLRGASPTNISAGAEPTFELAAPAAAAAVPPPHTPAVPPPAPAVPVAAGAKEQASEGSQKSMGTQITVQSAGQSITIEIGGSNRQNSVELVSQEVLPQPASKASNVTSHEEASSVHSKRNGNDTVAPADEAAAESVAVPTTATTTTLAATAPATATETSTTLQKSVYANLAMRAR